MTSMTVWFYAALWPERRYDTDTDNDGIHTNTKTFTPISLSLMCMYIKQLISMMDVWASMAYIWRIWSQSNLAPAHMDIYGQLALISCFKWGEKRTRHPCVNQFRTEMVHVVNRFFFFHSQPLVFIYVSEALSQCWNPNTVISIQVPDTPSFSLTLSLYMHAQNSDFSFRLICIRWYIHSLFFFSRRNESRTNYVPKEPYLIDKL